MDAVLSFHSAVLDRIESGLANWGDDFSEIERFNITESNGLKVKTATTPVINALGIGKNSGPLPGPAVTLPSARCGARIVSCLITPLVHANSPTAF